ncbi:MAG: hypothetical protein JF603_00385 [Acidobacteria bacterium]|nr:hypothetical protein [Acidobacteriota bacterium]
MGKASSSKKVARAARAAGKPGSGRNLVWPLTIGAVVILGVLLVAVTVAAPNKGKEPPAIGDHWHAAYGIFNCSSFINPLNDVVDDTTGLHTHGDSLMHIHPFSTKYTGKGANIGNWGNTTGLELTDTSIKAAGIDVKNGDKCDGKPGKVVMKVWKDPSDTTGTVITKDLAKYAPQNFNLITIAFVAEGATIPKPPDSAIAALQAPADVTGQPTATVPPTSELPPAATSSTTAPSSTSSTP